MTDCMQQTDYTQTIGALVSYRSSRGAQAEQPGAGSTETNLTPSPRIARVLVSAWKVISVEEDQGLGDQAETLLVEFNEQLIFFESQGFELSVLPPLWAARVEDGSLRFEWIFNDFRIGLSLEQDREFSSWYLISRSSLGDTNAAGYIWPRGVRPTVLWLMAFVLAHV